MSEQTGTVDPLGRVADELAALGGRLAAISAELRRLPVAPFPAAHPPPAQPVPPPAQPVPPGYPLGAPAAPFPPPGWPAGRAGFPAPPRPAQPVPTPARPRRPGLFEREGAGGRVLAWVGGALTLLGVVLMFVLAVQRGWLGPLPRVLTGAALGLALIALALRVRPRPGGRIGGLALAATGVAVLYLDVVTATVGYEFLPTPIGLLAGLVVAAAGVVLADRWRSQLLAVAVVLGAAVFAPVLTELEPVPLVGFLLVLQACAAPVQLRRNWSVLAAVAAAPPTLAALVVVSAAAFDGTDGSDGTATSIVLAAASATVVGVVVATLGAALRPGDRVPYAVLIGAPAPTLLVAPQLDRGAAAVLAALVAVALLGVWAAARLAPERLPSRFGQLAGGLAALATLETTTLALDGSAYSLTLLGQAVALAAVAVWLRGTGMVAVATGYGVLGTAVALATDLPPAALADFPARPFLLAGRQRPGEILVGLGAALLIAAVALVVPWAARRLGALRRRAEYRAAWVVAGLAVLYGAAAAVLCVALLVAPSRTGFLTGHVLVTVSWTVAALLLLVRGIRSVPLRAAGLTLVAAAVIKLVIFDLAALDGVARVAAFLGAGLVLLAAGTRYARLLAAAEQGSASPDAASQP